MAEHMSNPFQNDAGSKYTTGKTFTDHGIRRIAEFKRQLIIEEARDKMLKEGRIDDFISGEYVFNFPYDPSRLTRYGCKFPDNRHMLEYIASAATEGITQIVPDNFSTTAPEDEITGELEHGGIPLSDRMLIVQLRVVLKTNS